MTEITLAKLLEKSDVTIKLVKNKDNNYSYQIIYNGKTYVPNEEKMGLLDCIQNFTEGIKKLEQRNN